MREIFVVEAEQCQGGCDGLCFESVFDVTDEYGNWFASFKNKEDAHDYADLMRLRP